MKQFIYPYVLFKDTKEAVDYYISVFGGEVVYTMYGKDIPNCPEDQLETIYHLQYKLQGINYFSQMVLKRIMEELCYILILKIEQLWKKLLTTWQRMVKSSRNLVKRIGVLFLA